MMLVAEATQQKNICGRGHTTKKGNIIDGRGHTTKEISGEGGDKDQVHQNKSQTKLLRHDQMHKVWEEHATELKAKTKKCQEKHDRKMQGI